MSISKQHFDSNNNCFAEFENQQTVIVYSLKKRKCWRLTATHYYLYRIYCKPLKGTPNPFNVFIGQAKDLVGSRQDDIHSNTNPGYLYDIVEITKLPFIKDHKYSPMEIIKMIQQFIPNLSHNYGYKSALKFMRYTLRPSITSGKPTIYHWLMSAKTIRKISDNEFIFTVSVVPTIPSDESPRGQCINDIYVAIEVHLGVSKALAPNVAGILYGSQCISLDELKAYSKGNTDGLFEHVDAIIMKFAADAARF